MFDNPFPPINVVSTSNLRSIFQLQHRNGERGVKRNNLKPQIKKTNKKEKNIVILRGVFQPFCIALSDLG